MSDRAEEWEQEEAEVSKPVAIVVSVRVPQDLAERLYAEAARRGVRASELTREALQRYLSGDLRPAIVDVTISSADGPVTLYTGRSTQGRTLPKESSFHPSRA
jgi:hypothetical protein